jgi:dephospho-CoA kinase
LVVKAGTAPVARCEHRKVIVALIGGMGSGKTRVAEELRRHGARVISGDRLGHEALKQAEIASQVREHFGAEVFDEEGAVDRRKLGALVFADASKRRVLEEMVHPWIEKRFYEEIREADADPACRFVVLDAAVLLEAGWQEYCDVIVYVDAPRETRLARLAHERGWTAQEVERREQAQLPLADKAARAHVRLDNGGSAEQLSKQVQDLLQRLKLKT